MNKEKLNETKQTVDDSKQMVKEGTKIATHVATGNVIGAAADSARLVTKNKTLRRIIKIALLKLLLVVIIILFLASSVVSILSSIKDAIVKWLNSGDNRITSFWANYSETGEWMDMAQKDYAVEGSDEKYNIVEKYMIDLVQTGISLKQLRLFGDFEFTGEDLELSELEQLEKVLKNPDGKYTEQKKTIERYMAEFVRADVISQSMHRTNATVNVNKSNEDKIDGGIYLYRVKNPMDESSEELKEEDYIEMQYMNYDEFYQKLEETTNETTLKNYYTLDTSTGELVYVDYETDEEYEEDISSNTEWFQDLREWVKSHKDTSYTKVVAREHRVDYSLYISKYSMPIEFLINLCSVTSNPEFVYHLATLARDTHVELVIVDSQDITDDTIETYQHQWGEMTHSESNSVVGATPSGEEKEIRTRDTTIHTTTGSTIDVKKADSWSFFEIYRIKNNVTVNTETKYEGRDTGNVQVVLTQSNSTETGEIDAVTHQPILHTVYYDYDVIDIDQDGLQTTHTGNTFERPPIANPSIEKSKQFLGLLRNSTGKCVKSNCYRNSEAAYECAKSAVFDENGKNVAYKIPNMDREETPLNNLTSGLQLLYQLLGAEGVSEGKNTSSQLFTGRYSMDATTYLTPDESVSSKLSSGENLQQKLESIYNQKMQQIVLHLQYLMTFPPNETFNSTGNAYDPNYTDYILDADVWNYDTSISATAGQIASAREIFDFLVANGYTPEGACGILGNIQQESSFRTDASNGSHFGLVQWGGGRWTNLRNLAAQMGKDWTDLDVQLNHLLNELNGAYSYVRAITQTTASVHQATDIFCRKFEVCGNYGVEVERRYNYAKYWYNLFVLNDEGTNTASQQRLLYVLNNLGSIGGIANQSGYCQRFVRNVFEKLGITGNAASAVDAKKQWTESEDMSSIPVGACVYGKGSNTLYGHVGIYIGGGMVVHNIGKSFTSYGGLTGIKCESIQEWDSKYHFESWGWQGGVPLT